jgi:CheY-like chemotaxis protein
LLFLVVDDDELSRELLTLVLEVEGHEVEVAVSGDEALSRLESQDPERQVSPDVILADIQMPGLAGDDLVCALRIASRERSLSTMMLGMSASQPADSVLQAFDGFLMKPFTAEDLRSAMSSVGLPGECPNPPQPVSIEPLSDSGEPADVLDEEIYLKLQELMPASQLGQIYAMCIADARTRIAHMTQLAQAGDDAQYRREAHAVKGGSGMIGATELYGFAEMAENVGLDGKNRGEAGTSGVTEALRHLNQLSLACERLERILVERTTQ